jgi:hypothetical protein
MTVVKPSSPSGYTIFCDDIRKEDNGKLLFIGTYLADMTVAGSLPVLLPSFCMMVRYWERPTDPEESVEIRVFSPGLDEPIFKMPLDLSKFRGTPLPSTSDPDADPLHVALVPIRLSPFPIEAEGHIKVRAYRGDQEVRLGALPVRIAPLPQLAPPIPQV